MVDATPEGSPSSRWPDIPGVVWLIALAVGAVLIAVASQYGFHRDELYFVAAGRRLAWGYVDQPPLTPLVARIVDLLPGTIHPTVLRIPAALSASALVVLAAVLARRFGGGRRAIVLSAVFTAVGGFYLAVGHILSTTTFDVLMWVSVITLLAALIDGADTRLWIGVGAVIGVGIENKYTIGFLVLALAIGLLVTPQRRVLWTPMVLVGACVAIAIAAPTLIWQAGHGWPQIEMARSLSGRDSRTDYLLIQIAILSFFLIIPAAAGFVWLLRDQRGRAWRCFSVAFAILFLGFLVTGGRGYYVAPMYVPLLAAGAIWLERTRPGLRTTTIALVGVGAVVGLFIALPLLPPSAVGPFNEINNELGESYGWDQLVAQVEAVYNDLSPGERAGTEILTANYGQAGAIELVSDVLPQPVSGHNSYWDWGPPPVGLGPIILLGTYGDEIDAICPRLERVGEITNEVDLANDENGTPIWLCRAPTAPLASVWPSLRHLD